MAGVGDLSDEVAGTPFIFTTNTKLARHGWLGIAKSGRVYTSYERNYVSGTYKYYLKAYQSITSMVEPIWVTQLENFNSPPVISKIDETIYFRWNTTELF